MNKLIDEFLDNLVSKKRNSQKTLNKTFELISEQPNVMFELITKLLNEKQEISYITKGLSYISEKDLEKITSQIFSIIKENNDNEDLESIITYISLQHPQLLHPYLDIIWKLKLNWSGYDASYPWRNTNGKDLKFIKSILQNPEFSNEDRTEAFIRILESRNEEEIKSAIDYVRINNIIEREDIDWYILSSLESVSYTLNNDNIYNYCPSKPLHILFPKNHAKFAKATHPTYTLPNDGIKYKMGGILEADTNNPFFHIITLAPIPNQIAITGLEKLILGAHFREIFGYAPFFYQHNAKGEPIRIGDKEVVDLDVNNENGIKDVEVELAITPPRWFFQDWAFSNGNENLFRLGGEPSWIQNPMVLDCPICNKKMDFLMQLDSELTDCKDGSLYFGSGGICYIFWCDCCKVSGYFGQWT